MHQIEGVEDDGIGASTAWPRPKDPLKGTDAGFVNYGLTIKNCRFAAELGCRSNNRRITLAPIVSVAGEYAGLGRGSRLALGSGSHRA